MCNVLTLTAQTENFTCLFSLLAGLYYSEMLMSYCGGGMTVNWPFQVFSSNFQVNKP